MQKKARKKEKTKRNRKIEKKIYQYDRFYFNNSNNNFKFKQI